MSLRIESGRDMSYQATDEPVVDLSPRAKLEILGAILLALFLFALDQTVVGTALPRIITDLHGNQLYTWAVTVYLLTATISGPIYGKLSDLFGRRPIVIFAVVLFLVSSVLAGLSQEMWQLILFRGLQGLGGGAIFPVSLAVVADLYTPADRGTYVGLFGAVFGTPSPFGPALGLLFAAVCVWVESRAPEPIVPLGLFRMRAFTISVVSMFMAAFGFFGAIIFLPQWFQTVAGASATESGYNILPLLAGLIVSAIASGQIVARTGRYKVLIFVSLVLLAGGLYLLTNLHADTDRPVLWLWMLITGIGIGPSFAVFTLVVQNSVPPDEIGVATSSLTFFQQIGGTVGLTISSTILASRLLTEIPAQLAKVGVPPELAAGFARVGGSVDLTGTGI